ncbi:MAG: peptidase M23 [Bacteroidia bacterium]|nr:MAG: peptidase M23 [Bacteroidia bacterium]
MKRKRFSSFPIFLLVSLLIYTAAWFLLMVDDEREETVAEMQDALAGEVLEESDVFGFVRGAYRVEHAIVQRGQTLSHMLAHFGLGAVEADKTARAMQDVFSPRRIRSGNRYHGYFSKDSLEKLQYFVYEINDLDFLFIDYREGVSAVLGSKKMEAVEREAAGVIRSSLWQSMMDLSLHPELVMHLSRILAWSVDFHRVQSGDRFKVLYVENHVEGRSVGISHVEAVYFSHGGREIEGYRFEQDTIKGYYDREGVNLRRVFLRAPIEFGGRISSRYSHSRLHPIHGDRRPHLGTDYAAPHGTPILAVGDGVVTRASYTAGNGNYVRIRHNSVYETQYLHMSRFATGIRPGTRVSQGDVIGYVGSTGLATGPHVCFRFWKNGRQVDHLRLEFPSGDPLPEAYMEAFSERVKFLGRRMDALAFLE